MNLLSFAVTGMMQSQASVGGGGGNVPPNDAPILIEVDATTRQPSAVPESAWVSPGGTIIWTCAEPFQIILKLLWTGERVTRSSKKEGALHRLECQAGPTNGRYSYGIAVDGAESDPDVIIGPRNQNQ